MKMYNNQQHTKDILHQLWNDSQKYSIDLERLYKKYLIANESYFNVDVCIDFLKSAEGVLKICTSIDLYRNTCQVYIKVLHKILLDYFKTDESLAEAIVLKDLCR